MIDEILAWEGPWRNAIVGLAAVIALIWIFNRWRLKRRGQRNQHK